MAKEKSESGDKIREKSGKSDAGKNKKRKKSLGSAKGIETMYRNAYRAELDLIALAAAKANILISLNGIIVSVFIVSGGFFYSSSPLFLLPTSLFMFTSAMSVYFALLAASPEHVGRMERFIEWIRAMLKGDARFGDYRRYLSANDSYITGQSNVLIYEDRIKLSKPDYQAKMHELLNDQNKVYDKMNDQLYWLGDITATKFRLLGTSYFVFRWGLVLSVLSFITIKTIYSLLIYHDSRVVQLGNVGVAQFVDVYEPSAGVQLPDGRMLLVEDEAKRAFNILSFQADGSLAEDARLDDRLTASFGRVLSDLEGLAVGGNGYVYAITSHSSTKSGQRLPERENLVRFRVEEDKAVDVSYYSDLRNQIVQSEFLRDAIKSLSGKAVEVTDINIEGLTYNFNSNSLLVGFREPLIDGLSMVISISNPAEMFDGRSVPKFKDVALLPLEGGGIRSMNYDPVIDSYMLVNEVKSKAGEFQSNLWIWSGKPLDKPQKAHLPGMIDLKNVESIDSITVNGRSRLMISSDDGNAKKREPASYLLLEQDQLSITSTAEK